MMSLRGSRARAKAVFVLCLCSLAVVSIGTSDGATHPKTLVRPSVLGEGHFAGYRWEVAVNDDGRRRGVCMLVAILRRSGTGPGENAQCSAPALKRGNIGSLHAYGRNGKVALTVFGGAFNPGIGKVQAVMLDGKVRDLPFGRPRPGGGSQHLSRFRYVALAVKGPWCVSELVTRNQKGAVMLRTKGSELLGYSPVYQCRDANAAD
jgi:hypothetical protein